MEGSYAVNFAGDFDYNCAVDSGRGLANLASGRYRETSDLNEESVKTGSGGLHHMQEQAR